ncbi:Serine/threonine phosphatase stp [Eubacterium plexicaudatum ASF492]|uniref:PPM-type phosphatase domain-containing protein n=1 Tax=Eubacterium plexicaudatum ASF492 TaxID=1235802 RepID=N2AEC7_9FIRM|nr:Serine/threonine phosphatase stp [Eubacterium plexicaudatum ASF492]
MLSFDMISKNGEREYNEDYAGAEKRRDSWCFVLADGLGGHGGGDEASRLVSEYILEDFSQHGTVTETYLKKCFEESQQILLQEQRKQRRMMEMKTTLTVLLADDDRIWWGHIGDSRIYRFQNKKLQERTLDHSVPQMLALAGKLKEKQIRGHADRNRLLHVMGVEWDEPQYEIARPLQRTGGEVFLLCTDGFWEWIQEKTMQHLLKKADSPAEWLEMMEKAVVKQGSGKGMDNYTAVGVFL